MNEAAWLLLDRTGIVLGIVTGLATLGAAVWAWVERNDLKRWFRRNTFGAVSQPLPGNTRFDALVIPVSRLEMPCWLLDHALTPGERPTRVALLASKESRDAAAKIETHARTRGVAVVTHVLPDADDTAAFRAQAADCVRQFRRTGARKIAVDTTGGKVPMSLGCFMAAEETGATTLYVSAGYDPALKRTRPGSERLVAVTTPG